MSRAKAIVAAALAVAVAAEIPAAGQGGWHNGWLAAIYEIIGPMPEMRSTSSPSRRTSRPGRA